MGRLRFFPAADDSRDGSLQRLVILVKDRGEGREDNTLSQVGSCIYRVMFSFGVTREI